MKTTLFAALVMLCSLWAQAGTPSQDPTIAQLRERFKEAAVPTQEELAEGNGWKCAQFSAMKDSTRAESERSLQLEKFDGMLKQVFDSRIDPSDRKNPMYFTINSTGAITNMTFPRKAYFGLLIFRIDDDRNLIGEWVVTSPKVKESVLKSSFTESAVLKGSIAVAYELCVPL